MNHLRSTRARLPVALVLGLVAGVGSVWLAGPVAASAPEAATPSVRGAWAGSNVPAGDLVRAGRYRLGYFGKDLGEEVFEIRRTADGYVIDARVEPRAGDQVPSVGRYYLDRDRRLLRATWRELGGGGVEADYRLEDDVLHVDVRGPDGTRSERFEVGADAIIAGPHYVTDFYVLAPLSLDVRDEHERTAYTFGFDDWRPEPVEFTAKRERDRRLKVKGGDRLETSVYRCRIRTGEDKTYKTRSWLDDDGVSVRVTIDLMLGAVDIRLSDAPASSRP